jgi:hypothetical protein
MNLTEYPTPKSDAAEWMTELGTSVVCYDVSAELEREAAAWKAVANALHAELDTAFNGYAGQYMRIEALVTLDAFDALKSQLNEKP